MCQIHQQDQVLLKTNKHLYPGGSKPFYYINLLHYENNKQSNFHILFLQDKLNHAKSFLIHGLQYVSGFIQICQHFARSTCNAGQRLVRQERGQSSRHANRNIQITQ